MIITRISSVDYNVINRSRVFNITFSKKGIPKKGQWFIQEGCMEIGGTVLPWMEKKHQSLTAALDTIDENV